MTSDPEKLGKVYGPFKNVSYVDYKYSAQGNMSDLYAGNGFQHFEGIFKINLDDYCFKFDEKPNCCEHVSTSFISSMGSDQRIIPEKLEYFYFKHPSELMSEYQNSQKKDLDKSPCFLYHVYFVHSDNYVLIYEVCNSHEGYYPHALTLKKGLKLLFKTYV